MLQWQEPEKDKMQLMNEKVQPDYQLTEVIITTRKTSEMRIAYSN